MKASAENPIYTTYIIAGQNKYNLTPVVVSLDFSDQKKQMAQCVTIGLMNVQVDGQWLTSLLKVRQRVFVYADDGTKNEEVFRGYVWIRPYKSGLTDRIITLKCYDDLIYFQESEDAVYFSAGKSSKDVLSTLCGNWGVKLDYKYESITHSKLALRGNLADIIMADVLDLVKDRTGKKYVIRSEKGTVKVLQEGTNSQIYSFKLGQNAISTSSECTMNGMVTKVKILGKADDQTDREPVEATVSGNTSGYGITNNRFISVWKRYNKIINIGSSSSIKNLLIINIPNTIADIILNRIIEKFNILRDDTYIIVQIFQFHICYINSINFYLPFINVIIPKQQIYQGRLTNPALPNNHRR